MVGRDARSVVPVDRPMFWEPSVAFLKWAIVLILVSSAAFLVVLFIVAPEQIRSARGGGPVILSLVATAALLLLWRGKIKASVYVLGAGLWAYITAISFLLGGLNSIVIIVYPLIIMMAGWLLGPRTAVAFSVLTVAACFGFFQAELRGVLPLRPPTSPALLWVVQTAVFIFSALLITYLVRSYRDRLEEVRKLGSALALRTAEVQAHEADLNRAQAVSHVGSWLYEPAGDVIHLSAETCRIFGLPEGTMGSRDSYLARVHPEDRSAVDSAWQTALKGGKPLDHEHRIMVGKSIRWVRQKAQFKIGADATPLRSVGTTQDITELKRHEAEVLAARSQLEATLDAIPDLLFEVGLDGRYYDYHSPRVDLLATPPENFLGKTVSEVLPPAAAAIVMSALREAHEKGRSHGKQLELEVPQGKLWFELSVSRKLVGPEEEPRFIFLSRDITERKRTEEELNKHNVFVESLLENAPIGFAVNTIDDGQTVFVGRNFESIYGVAPGSIHSAAEFFEKVYLDPVQRQKMRERVMADMASGDPARMRWEDIPIRTQAGENKVITAVNIPLPEHNLMISTVQDVTEANRAQAALRESEKRYHTLFANSNAAMLLIDPADGSIVDANAAACAYYGWDLPTLQAMRMGDINTLSRDEVLVEMERARNMGKRHFDFHHRIANGEIRDVEVFSGPVEIDGRELLLSIVQDVTELKRTEAARDQLEAQLRESQKMEALGTLAGGVAHDFNNVLATIMGNVELARQDVGPQHAALESLEEIRKASRRAKDLVQQILAFGRRQVIERRVILLAPVVAESARLLRTTLPAGVSLSVECAPDVPPVLADPTQVQQVLLNLCANAWQAMQGQERPAAIQVSLAAHLANGPPYKGPERRTRGGRVALYPGRYACLTVRDNGPGMDDATVKRIFEPFFTTKPVGEGTGLGLAVVHGIVQEHKASIEVQSAPDDGAIFRIYFPAVETPVPTVAAQAPDCAPAPGQGRHILYVDDDEAIVFLMTRLLERQGYRVSGYTDAHEALAAVRAKPRDFDLAVTDYNMPGLSGLEVAHALREIRADLPVALASGYITEELRAEAPAAGVIELVYKPNTVDELCEVVARLANAQREKGNATPV